MVEAVLQQINIREPTARYTPATAHLLSDGAVEARTKGNR